MARNFDAWWMNIHSTSGRKKFAEPEKAGRTKKLDNEVVEILVLGTKSTVHSPAKHSHRIVGM